MLPGSVIVTDAWAVYANIDQINNCIYNTKS